MPATVTWSSTSPLQRGTAVVVEDACGLQESLRTGTRLEEFEIVQVLGVGGFGIVYLAIDHVLRRQVAIKEYLPTTLASRGQSGDVRPRSDPLAETFARGLESFCNEARLLANFDHPSLVKVHRFWKANGTAYMAMPFYPGKTLKRTRSEMAGVPDGAWLLALVEPLLGALEALHREGVYHRDIAPDNILIQPDGRPVLLDFGSARRVIGDRTQALTAILKPNFAPVEQYADEVGMRQGPWTDLYALGATFHFMLTGKPPAPAVMRAVRDAMPVLALHGAVDYPGVQMSFLSALDWTLAIAPDDRPQSVAALRSVLQGATLPPKFQRGRNRSVRSEHANDATDAVITSDVAPLTDTPVAARRPGLHLPSGRTMLAGGCVVAVMAITLAVIWLARPSVAQPVPQASAAPPAAMATIETPTSAVLTAEPMAQGTRSDPTVQNKMDRAASQAQSVRPPVAAERLGKACAGLNFFARTTCISRLCRQAEFAATAECVDAKRVEDQRQQRMAQ